MTDPKEQNEGVPGQEPGAPGDGFLAAEGPDVEAPTEGEGASFSDADQAFLEGLSTPEAQAGADQAAEHLADLRRVTAEYANYRRRVERERVVERERAVGDAARAILPVLDDLDRAEAHGDLADGGTFATIAQKLRGAAGRLGLTPFGVSGQLFDPREHDAIFQRENPAVEKATVSDVVERGYRVGDTVLRPAKVVVDTPAS
jgi:molecular chaperone GrpE